jgi:hypothetical protein
MAGGGLIALAGRFSRARLATPSLKGLIPSERSDFMAQKVQVFLVRLFQA